MWASCVLHRPYYIGPLSPRCIGRVSLYCSGYNLDLIHSTPVTLTHSFAWGDTFNQLTTGPDYILFFFFFIDTLNTSF